MSQDELVRAFELSKDQYVEITDEHLEQLPLPAKHTIELSSFTRAGEIDPIYYEKSYYLEPEETAVKRYALLLKVLEKKGVTGVATIALRNKESLCALRSQDGALLLETLYYPDEIRERELELPNVLVNERELSIAATLVDALEERFDPGQYHDHYREALLELIQSKAEGRAVVVRETASDGGQVTDLMAALRASIEAAKKRKGSPDASAPAARHEASTEDKPGRASAAAKKPARKRTRAA